MELENLIEQLESWRSTVQRPAWKPIVEAGDESITASKFSGQPWLAIDEPYPCCGDCHAPMPLFLQLNLADLPDALAGRFGSGLLQLFYCTNDDCVGGWEAFSASKLVRLVQPGDRAQSLQLGNYPSLPPKTITGWTQLEDYPNPQEFENLGLVFHYDFAANTIEIQCPSVGLTAVTVPMEAPMEMTSELETICLAEAGDKLAGYPHWIQGLEYPNCPQCDRRMELVFQLDSEDNLPFMFGDVGCGHITQCPEHKEVVTFAWACG